MGRGTLAAGVGYTAIANRMTATVLRLNPSNAAEASAMINADIAAKAAITMYLVDMDHDGGSDDAVILMTLLYHEQGPVVSNPVARCWSASNASQAQAGLLAAIAEAGADTNSNYVILNGLAGCGQGHQFLGYIVTIQEPGP